MLRFTLPLMALLAGCAATPEQIASDDRRNARDEEKLARELAGLVPGRPTACVNTRNLNVQVFGDRLLYKSSNRRAYLNQTTGGCFGLRRDDIIVTQSFNAGQQCSGEIIRTVDRTSGFPSGACSFGEWIPYTRAPRG
jgi:hypothetical protein